MQISPYNRLLPGFIFFSVLLASLGCSERKASDNNARAVSTALPEYSGTIPDDLPWSQRMALSVLKRNPKPWMIDFRDSPKWNYTQGLVLSSLLRVGESSGDDRYFQYVKAFADELITEEGEIGGGYEIANFNIDHIKPGDILFDLHAETGEEKYLQALQTLRNQLRWQPRTTEGGFWHKLRYPWQMWLDGLYMGSPFYTRYATVFGEPEAFEEVARQVTLMAKHTRDARTGLLYHGWDESRVQRWSNPETGQSPCFWGRAMGWYMMAIVDLLDYFPEDHPDRDAILDVLRETSRAIIAYQDGETGLWYQVLDQGSREGNYLEATVSTMFSYALAKGHRKGYLDKECLQAAEKAYRGILEHLIEVDETGEVHLHKCCMVAGLGGDPYRDGSYEYYINEPVRSNDPKGVGPFMLVSLEFEQMK